MYLINIDTPITYWISVLQINSLGENICLESN